MNKVYLKPKKEESLLRFHPWVFSGAIARVEGNPEEGEVVEVYTSDKQYIATGHYQIGSIAVRVLSFKKATISPDLSSTSTTIQPSCRPIRQVCISIVMR